MDGNHKYHNVCLGDLAYNAERAGAAAVLFVNNKGVGMRFTRKEQGNAKNVTIPVFLVDHSLGMELVAEVFSANEANEKLTIDLAREGDDEMEWAEPDRAKAFEEILSSIQAGSKISIDYVLFTVCAALIAAVGLGRDDVVAVVASMLISPLMGPILGITVGFVTMVKTKARINQTTDFLSKAKGLKAELKIASNLTWDSLKSELLG
jgi:hypothetical protein